VASDDDRSVPLIVEYQGPRGAVIIDGIEYPRMVKREMPREVHQRLVDTGVAVDHPFLVHGPRTKSRVADPGNPTLEESARLAAHHGEPTSPGGV
jgi:hypothetical protein